MASDLARRLGPIALLALGACTGADGMKLGIQQPDNFGEANRQTFAAQVIDPAPAYDDPMVGGNGDKAAQAIERYRTDKVKQPERAAHHRDRQERIDRPRQRRKLRKDGKERCPGLMVMAL